MSTSANLVVNGDCETGSLAPDFNTWVAPSGWTLGDGQLDAQAYSAGGGGDLNTAYANANGDGLGYFSGGNAGFSSAYQIVDLSSFAAKIDSGSATFNFGGDFGGYAGQDDSFSATITFYGADGTTVLGSDTIGGFKAADRGSISELIHDADSAAVPAGARFVRVELDATRISGTYNDGYADNISLTLTTQNGGGYIITVTRNHDYSGASFSGIDTIQFAATKNANATFAAEQFGAGIAANSFINGDDHNNTLTINVGAGHAFDGSSLNFSNWSNKDAVVINGSGSSDTIAGSVVNDTIAGGAGGDSIRGGFGADLLKGEGGADHFVYNAAAESTGVVHDTIDGFDSSDDFIDISATGIHFHTVDLPFVGGTLSSKHFDKDLKNALDSTHLGKNDAVLYQPNAGDLAGHTFLVIDANHKAGYQAGDIVIELTNGVSLSSLDDTNILS